jgi:heme-degrading monooxygenase HmoA
MVYVSVTRLRVRSARYLLAFIPRVWSSGRQAKEAVGFLGGKLLYEFPLTFWTATTWADEAAMRAYRISGAHRDAMPLLLDWCDEAAVAHWSQSSAILPDWMDWLEAHRRMVTEGRLSKVNYPSSAQAAARIAEPRPSPFELRLRPVINRNLKPAS